MIVPETPEPFQDKSRTEYGIGGSDVLPAESFINPDDFVQGYLSIIEVSPTPEIGMEVIRKGTVFDSSKSPGSLPTGGNPESRSTPKSEPKRKSHPYQELGGILLGMLGERTPDWLAGQLQVSSVAVHTWVSGKYRPRAYRLGKIAALLECSGQAVEKLAELAGYEYKKVVTAAVQEADYQIRSSQELERREVFAVLADRIIKLLRTDDEFRKIIGDKAPELLELVSTIPKRPR